MRLWESENERISRSVRLDADVRDLKVDISVSSRQLIVEELLIQG